MLIAGKLKLVFLDEHWCEVTKGYCCVIDMPAPSACGV